MRVLTSCLLNLLNRFKWRSRSDAGLRSDNEFGRISAEQFTEQGLSGQALGDAIYAERLSVLSTEISAPGTAPGL